MKNNYLATTGLILLAAFACLIDSIVCGFTPSSAATTKTTISVNQLKLRTVLKVLMTLPKALGPFFKSIVTTAMEQKKPKARSS